MITVVGNVEPRAVLDCISKFEQDVIVQEMRAAKHAATAPTTAATAGAAPKQEATTTTTGAGPAAAPAEKPPKCDRCCEMFENDNETEGPYA